MNEESDSLKEVRKEFPFLVNVKSPAIVEMLKLFKAKLYDLERDVTHCKKMVTVYETELLFRPYDKTIHYFDRDNRYHVDEEKKK